MKKLSLIAVVILIMFNSCTTYYGISGGNGCGVWYPKKFEKDKAWKRAKIRSNPNSAYNRMGRGW